MPLKENNSEEFKFCYPSRDNTKGQTDLTEALGSNWYDFIYTAYFKKAKHSYHLLPLHSKIHPEQRQERERKRRKST